MVFKYVLRPARDESFEILQGVSHDILPVIAIQK